uniref:phosphotriesterase family protein n=1 Tax=Roseovarius sp. TaxID=1486281 RepID=UPI003566FE7B
TFTTPDEVRRLADTGCVLEWDFFGVESSHYPFADFDMPNDAGRLALIRPLLEEGQAAQVVISHDICTQTRLRRRGGHGYAHILTGVLPAMRRKGMSEAALNQVLLATPRRLLTLPQD